MSYPRFKLLESRKVEVKVVGRGEKQQVESLRPLSQSFATPSALALPSETRWPSTQDADGGSSGRFRVARGYES